VYTGKWPKLFFVFIFYERDRTDEVTSFVKKYFSIKFYKIDQIQGAKFVFGQGRKIRGRKIRFWSGAQNSGAQNSFLVRGAKFGGAKFGSAVKKSTTF
jgi:hypothetical protein